MIKKSFQNLWEKAEKELSSLNPDSLFYLLVFLLPTQLGLHFWPDFSFVSGIRIDYLSPTLFVSDLIIFTLFFYSLWKKELKISKLSPYISLMVLFVIIGVIISKNPLAGVYSFFKIIEITFLIFYVSKHAEIRKTILFFSIAILFQSILAIAQFLFQHSMGGPFYLFGERMFNSQTPNIANAVINGSLFLRPYGTLPHPNVLAGFLILGMTFVISFFKPKNIQEKIFFLLTILIGSFALILTMSRISILLWVIFLPTLLFINYKRYAFLFLIPILVFLILLSPIAPRFNVNFSDRSLIEREDQLSTSFKMIKDNMVFGVGLNNYLTNVPYYSSSKNYYYLQPVHNIYLLAFSQIGIVAFAIFLVSVLRYYKTISSKFKLIFILIALLGLFDHYFITLQQGQLLLSLFVGLSLKRE